MRSKIKRCVSIDVRVMLGIDDSGKRLTSVNCASVMRSATVCMTLKTTIRQVF